MSPSPELRTRLQAITAQSRRDPASAWDLAHDGEPGSPAAAQAGVAAAMLGAALAALDEYEEFVRGRITEPVPAPPGDQETDYRRWLGMAIGRLETADCILEEAALDAADETRARMLAREVTRLAYETAQDLLVHVSGAGAAGERMTAAASVMLRLWADPLGAADDQFSRQVARERLQLA